MSRPKPISDPLGFVLEAAWSDIVLKQKRHPSELVSELCATRMYGDALVFALVQLLSEERARRVESSMFDGQPSSGLLGDCYRIGLYEQLMSLAGGGERSPITKEPEKVNAITLSGRLTRDPEVKDVGNGHALCRFRMAFRRRIKKGTRWEDETGFIDVALWHAAAEAAGRSLTKGSLVVVTGELRYREYDDRDGNRRSELSIQAQEFEKIEPATRKESNDRDEYEDEAPPPARRRSTGRRGDESRGTPPSSEIPF